MSTLLEMRGIEKAYGAVRANREIDLTVQRGSVVGLLGENGSGKSTLMKILFGMVRPDRGSIFFDGARLAGHTPRTAMAAGIGMVHQHFTLVESMTAAENVMLGRASNGVFLKPGDVTRKISEASRTYALSVRPEDIVADLSFGQRQRLEILKAILRGTKLLILDEPTSNLSLPEVTALLAVIRRLKAQGHAVIFISHKLSEVTEVCDEVVVLRDGAVAGSVRTREATAESLARMMVERDLSAPLQRDKKAPGPVVLAVENLCNRAALHETQLKEVSFTIQAGEILAVAGVDGNGQRELLETLAGIKHAATGRIVLNAVDMTRKDVRQRLKAGMAYIPVDRAATSLIPGLSIAGNLAMRDIDRPPLAVGPFLRTGAIQRMARARMKAFDIRGSSADAPAGSLSGGNQQKIVLAREIGRRPKLLLAFQPTWGLDPGAARFVLDQMLLLRDAGGAILYVSTELEEVLGLGDRIAVLSGGRLSKPAPREAVNVTGIGMLMAGAA